MTFQSKLEAYCGDYETAAPYRFHRARGIKAARALALAKADLIAGVRRYPGGPGAIGGTPGDRKAHVWVSSPGDFGLRFLGFADELLDGRAIDHKGWFTSDNQDSVMRGAIYALPGRDGVTRILAGYRTGSEPRRGGDWTDDCGEVSGLIDFGQIYESEAREDAREYCDALRSACYAADSMAQRDAEQESEYQAAWQLGNDAREAVADARTWRAKARDGLNELRGLDGSALPALCARVRESIASDLESAREHYRKARRLWEANDDSDGFKEGAGFDTFAELLK